MSTENTVKTMLYSIVRDIKEGLMDSHEAVAELYKLLHSDEAPRKIEVKRVHSYPEPNAPSV